MENTTYTGKAKNKVTGEVFFTRKKTTYQEAYQAVCRLAKRRTIYDNCDIDVIAE